MGPSKGKVEKVNSDEKDKKGRPFLIQYYYDVKALSIVAKDPEINRVQIQSSTIITPGVNNFNLEGEDL